MRVAIIGAGFSGLLAAYLLEKQGVTVTVYEKEEQIGGHCRTLVHKDLFIEMGTSFCLNEAIKSLLIELDIEFTERFSYRNFLDAQFASVEQIRRDQVPKLLEELNRLRQILSKFPGAFYPTHYGTIYEELSLNLEAFLEKYQLETLALVIEPHLSSFGFGHLRDISAFYAFSVFDFDTINAFILSEKILFIDKGFSDVIHKLSQNISDIRYGIAVETIDSVENHVIISTAYGTEIFDQVLVTARLADGVLQDDFYNGWMQKLETNPFISLAYKSSSKKVVTTYYNAHMGQYDKIQFFHTFKQHQKTILVAYAYGYINNGLVKTITEDIEKINVHVKHLIAVKQWQIFPHVKMNHLTPDFYTSLADKQQHSRIRLVGTLISKPSIGSLYTSITHSVNALLQNQ